MTLTTEHAPHFENLTRALGDKIGTSIDKDELKDEFEKYLEYGVPPDQAAKTLMRHHGAAPAPQAAPSTERTSIRDLPANVPFVTVMGRFITLNTRTVNARGEEKEILWGLFGDETGTVSYTSWRSLEGFEKGDVAMVAGAYTKEFRGEIQLNFGDRTQLEKQDAEAIPKVPETFTDTPLGELRDGLRGLRVKGRILDVAPREVQVKGEPKTLWGGTIADETGKAEFTSWHDHGLKAGQVVTIEGGYVRAFRGVPQFNFDEEATVTPVDEAFPDAETLDKASTVTLGELVERGGGNDVRVVADLLEVREGSGLIFRCPEDGCSRVLQHGQCRIHGKGEGKPDLRVKGVLDDGTGAVSVIVGRELTETLLGKDLDACLAEAKEAFRHEVIQEQLQEKLTGRVFSVEGNVLSDDFGLMFLARRIDLAPADAEKEAQELMADLPGEAF